MAAPAAAPGVDVTSLLLAVVADKTGYPPEMLNLSMDLEADLGVDSIKRVEILSAMRERAPDLPEVDAGELASLQTLAQIVAHLGMDQAGSHAAVDVAPVTETGTVGRHVVVSVPAPASGLALHGLTAGVLQIVDGGSGLAASLAATLAATGLEARAVDVPTPGARGVVLLHGLRPILTREDGLTASREAFAATKVVAPDLSQGVGCFVTVQATGGDFGLAGTAGMAAWSGGLSALAKTVALEWPDCGVKAIDVATEGLASDEVVGRIATELLAGGVEREVGLLADGGRITLDVATEEAAKGDALLGPKDVVVASGGARGVTAATMVALAKDARARFVLLGRTPLVEEPAACAGAVSDADLKRALLTDAKARGEALTPAALGRAVKQILAGREVRDTLAAIASAGGAARYVAADVTDAGALADALNEVRGDWGPITAIVHGAGVLADRFVVDKTQAQFDFVFDTKTRGLCALLDATQDDPLKAIVMFSSVAARTGNTGQVDYAMANATLDKVAALQAATRDGCVVKSMGWGPWEGGMVTSELARHFERMGVPLIPLHTGAAMLVDELRTGGGVVEIVYGGKPGGAALGAAADAEVRAGIHVAATTWPMLGDHRVKGEVVVPVAMAVEWLARAARACRPGLTVDRLTDIDVVRGIRVSDFEGKGLHLAVHAKQLENGQGATVRAELSGPDGRLHYRAHVHLTSEPIPDRTSTAQVEAPAFDAELYDGRVLFHGKQFQVIRDVQVVGDDGVRASLTGLTERGWTGQDWCLDPAALDGLLQLGVLWTEFALQGGNLPTGIGAVHVQRGGPVGEAARGVLQARDVGADHTRYDALLVDEQGVVILDVRDARMHRLPGEGPARDWAGRAQA